MLKGNKNMTALLLHAKLTNVKIHLTVQLATKYMLT